MISLLFVSVFFFLVFYFFRKLEEGSVLSENDAPGFMEVNPVNDHRFIPENVVKTKTPSNSIIDFMQDGDVEDPRLGSDIIYSVIILVHSGVNELDRREAIRETWLSESMVTMDDITLAYWFLIGGRDLDQLQLLNLRKEQEKCGDLLILTNVDNSYQELPQRTLYSMTYIAQHYKYTYLLKTDDDVYINLPIVLGEMKKLRPTERLYWGRFSCHNPPMVNGQWKEENWHWCDVYYPYAYGGMYVLTSDVVSLVADNAPFLQLYSCEDVSLGVWLGPYNLIRINDARIFVQHNLSCSRGFIALHIPSRQVPKVIRKTHDNLKRKGVLCSTFLNEDLLLWRGLPERCETVSIAVV